MFPLGLLLLFANPAYQAQPADAAQNILQLKLPDLAPANDSETARQLAEQQRNTCFTMRSYMFRQQDGHALVPAGMTTCTPASVSHQRQVSSGPRIRLVPLSVQPAEK